jgi:hypothetical protein
MKQMKNRLTHCLSGTVLIALSSCAARGVPPDIVPLIEKEYETAAQQAIDYLKQMRASSIEKALPSIPFEQWIKATLGPDLRWGLNDCGEGGGREGSVPICVEASRSDGSVTLYVGVGTSEKGIFGRPQLGLGQIEVADTTWEVRNLKDLPPLLRAAEAAKKTYRLHPLRPVSDEEAIRVARNVSVRQLDKRVPDEPVATWLERQMPAGTMIQWDMKDCPGFPQQPSCVSASATWLETSVVIQINMEFHQRGLNEPPSWAAQIWDRAKGRITGYKTLPDLAAAIRKRRS